MAFLVYVQNMLITVITSLILGSLVGVIWGYTLCTHSKIFIPSCLFVSIVARSCVRIALIALLLSYVLRLAGIHSILVVASCAFALGGTLYRKTKRHDAI